MLFALNAPSFRKALPFPGNNANAKFKHLYSRGAALERGDLIGSFILKRILQMFYVLNRIPKIFENTVLQRISNNQN